MPDIKDMFETTKICLKTHSYLHIGGNQQRVTHQKYVRFNNKLHVIDEARLGKVLYDKDEKLIDKLCQGILTQPGFKLHDFLKENGLLTEEYLKKYVAYPIDLGELKNIKEKAELMPFTRDGNMRPYIPGSAIKGALRTALIYHILKEMEQNKPEEFKGFFTKHVQSILKDFENAPKYQQTSPWYQRRVKNRFADWLPYSLLQKFFLTFYQSRFGPHTDIFRAVKVSDSESIEGGLRLQEVLVMSPSQNGVPGESSKLYVECVKPDIEINFNITLDKKTLSDFYKSNQDRKYFADIPQLLSYMQEFAQDQWEYEQRYLGIKPASSEDQARLNYTALNPKAGIDFQPLKQFYRTDAPNFRLGWGCGLIGTTVDLLLDGETREKLRNLLFDNRPGEPAPKSRRLVWDSQSHSLQQPLGWALVD